MDPKSQPGTSQAVRLLSKDTATEGFDLAAGETWIYPTNYPTREYQFKIIQKALLKNTLVSLPTGLGKTFIAAVVMYNFYRWYPEGKLVFMAPTKPLVKQQVDACYNIMAIPLEVTAELTGAKQSAARTDVWTEKRVFYITPQVLQNDLNRIEQLGSKIKCLVFDEAHKARGNHAYCEVIQRLLAQGHKHFRVLALSATPGNTVNDVLEVVQNLLISHLEFRTEESLDVQPYVFQRTLETVVVPLSDKLIEVREKYLDILEYYTKNLKNYKIVQGNCGSLTKGKIFMLMKEFQTKHRGTGSGHYAEIMRSLNICVTLYHAFELLIRHGLRNFLSFFEEHMEKPLLRGNHYLRVIVDDVRKFLGPIPDIEKLPDGTYPDVPTNIKFGHPKYYKLRDILVSHFRTSDQNTRVIVFFEYRESVMEAHLLLLQSRPIIQPRIFLGQGSGITQKVQIGVVKAFREGKCNVLLSTCIGEEGLDVGEVDLIICFDISTKSPIRMVQRMGRTGRKRAGKVLVLVTEGKEQQTLKDCLIQKNNISTFVLGSKQLSSGMYPESPRLVPEDINPRCEKIYITVKKKPLVLKKNGSIKDMLGSMSSGSNELIFSQELVSSDNPERIKMFGSSFFNKKNDIIKSPCIEKGIFSKHVEKQRKSQKIYKIKHSKQSETLVKLLQISDSKRFNLPTQIQNTQANTKLLKQGDIRNMFLTAKSEDQFETPKSTVNTDISTQELAKNFEKNDEFEVQNEGFAGTKELFAQISNFIFFKTTDNQKSGCRHCPNNFSCTDFKITLGESDVLNNNYLILSDTIFKGITADDIESFTKSLDYKNEEFVEMENDCVFENIDFTQLEEQRNQENKNINEKSFRFQAPDTLCEILNKFGDSILTKTQLSQQHENKVKTFNENNDNTNIPKLISDKELLEFFKMDNLFSIFEPNSITNSSQETIAYSPDLEEFRNILPKLRTPQEPKELSPVLDESIIIEEHESPILSSEDRVKMLRRKVLQRSKRYEVQKDLFNTSELNVQNVCDIPEKEMDRSMSPDFALLSQERGIMRKEKSQEKKELLKIGDICDISNFLGAKSVESKNSNQNNLAKHKLAKNKSNDYKPKTIPLDKLIDESLFDLLTPPLTKNDETNNLSQFQEDKSKSSNHDKTDIFGDLVDDSMIILLTQTNNFNATEGQNTTHEMENKKDSLRLLSEPFPKTSDIDRKSTQELRSIRSNDQNGLKNVIKNSRLPLKTSCTKNSYKSSSKGLAQKSFNGVTEKSKIGEKLEHIGMTTKHTDSLLNFATKGLFFESTPIRKPQNERCTKNYTKEEKKSSSDEFVKESLKDLDNNDNKKLDDRNADHKKLIKNAQQSQNKGFNFEDTWFTSIQTNNKTAQIAECDKEETNNKSDAECIDLTLDSPSKSTAVKTQSNLTQIDITQMLSLINKTQNKNKKLPANPFGSQITQKETQANVTNTQRLFPFSQVCREPLTIGTQKVENDFSQNIGSSFNFGNGDSSDSKDGLDFNEKYSGVSSQKENKANKSNTSNSRSDNSGSLNESSFTSSGWKSKPRKNLLSTKRKCNLLENSENNFRPAGKCAAKAKLDPYGFITQPVQSPVHTIGKIQSKSGSTTETFTSSDDEFDVKPKTSPVFIKPKSINVPKTKMRTKSKKNKVKNKENPFLELEAELSDDDNVFVSSDEDEGNSDYLEDSFVVPNATQNFDTQMHAHYLKSVRSPLIAGGRFKIPHRTTHNISNVFSQPVNQEENTYLEDSFCVDKDESQLQHELSELEILEMKLKNKKKKRKKSQEDERTSKLKRRRIIVINSDSE